MNTRIEKNQLKLELYISFLSLLAPGAIKQSTVIYYLKTTR